MSVFETLNNINVNGHTEKKNGLTYLPWAWAWSEVKKAFPNANYTIYENPQGWNYFTDGKTCWVKVGVTIEELEHIEYLPVMDFKNKSIKTDDVTSFDVNKAIQRALAKACARHGLGLYIYAGEDLPEEEAKNPEKIAPYNEKVEEAELRAKILKFVNTKKMKKEVIDKTCKRFGVENLNELSIKDCRDLIAGWHGADLKEKTIKYVEENKNDEEKEVLLKNYTVKAFKDMSLQQINHLYKQLQNEGVEIVADI